MPSTLFMAIMAGTWQQVDDLLNTLPWDEVDAALDDVVRFCDRQLRG